MPQPKPKPQSKLKPYASPTRALSIAEPWAYLIAAGFKQLENRTWRTDYRGPMAIHAGKTRRNMFDEAGTLELCDLHPKIFAAFDDERIDDEHPLFQFGAIIGVVDVIDCVAYDPRRDDPAELFDKFNCLAAGGVLTAGGPAPELPVAAWAEGPYCWVLANPRRFAKPIACNGKLSLWSLPPELRQAVAAAGRFILTDPGQPPKPPADDPTIEKPTLGKIAITPWAKPQAATDRKAGAKAEQRREVARDRRRQKLVGGKLPDGK